MEQEVVEFTPTESMKRFGITAKFCQKPKEEDNEFPFWASAHHYDDSVKNWGKVNIPITPFQQSGMTHYFGVIELGMADAICRVPALAKATDSMEICRRTLNQDVTEQYQRPLMFDRINNIQKFLSDNPTIINPIIIDLPRKSMENESSKISQMDDGSFSLDINLQNIDFITDNLKDNDDGKHIDFRPVDLVDGQHRVRSSKHNNKALELSIPFVLINPEYQGGGGRIFAEINVQHEKLDSLHELHLRYVLCLSSHRLEDDFGEYDEDFVENKSELSDYDFEVQKNRFANRLSYKIGARLNLNQSSPLHGLIRYYGNKEKAAIDAKDWVSICREWILQNIELARDEDQFLKCIQAYFEAWKITSNLDPDTGESYVDVEENNRWGDFINPGTGMPNRSVIFKVIWFRSIMKLFPQCYTLGRISRLRSELDIEEKFLEILTPCRPIDGTDLLAWGKINQDGKPIDRENHIYQWMAWAIHDYAQTGIVHEPHLVWNTNNPNVKSKPGAGFFSNINPEFFSGMLEIENVPFHNNDETGMKISIFADSMPNESQSKLIKVDVYDGNGNIVKGRRKTNVKGPHERIGPNHYIETLPKRSAENGCSAIEITISSGNLFDKPPSREIIFRQKYTIKQLRKISDSKVLLSNKAINFNNSKLAEVYTDLELEDSENKHYIYEENEDLFEGQNDELPDNQSHDELESIEDEEEYDTGYVKPDDEDEVFHRSGPPPSNQYHHGRPRGGWMPVPYPSDFCLGCRWGTCNGCNYA